MRWNLQNWIESVKAKPEPIRYRYMVGCVAVSMFFVIIVWSLTITETFKQNINQRTAESVNSVLPRSSDFSLDEILSGDGRIGVEASRTGEEFLQEQEANRTKLNPEEEGLRPKDPEAEKEEAAESEIPDDLIIPTLP